VCWPTAFPAALTLSTTDVSQTTVGWTCEKLDVLDLLKLGDRLTYYLARALYWLLEG
jgi:hypothetical protein